MCVSFLVAASRKCSLLVVHGLFTAVALVAEQGLWSVQASAVVAHGLRGLGSWAPWSQLAGSELRLCSWVARAYLLRCTWDLRDQGPNPCPLHWQVGASPLHHQGGLQNWVPFCRRQISLLLDLRSPMM